MKDIEQFFELREQLENTQEYENYMLAKEAYETHPLKLKLDEMEKEIKEELIMCETNYESVLGRGKFTFIPAKISKEFDAKELENLSIKYPEIMDCQKEVVKSKAQVRLTRPRVSLSSAMITPDGTIIGNGKVEYVEE